MLRKIATFLLLLVAVPELALADQDVAPLLRAREPIPNNYLITLADAPDRTRAEVAQQVAAAHGGRVVHTYDRAFRAAHIELASEASFEAMRRNPNVIAVEEDGIVRLSASTSDWGLDRIDQVYLPLDGQYNTCSGGQGYGVRVYVVDNGIRAAHQQFWTNSTNTTSRVKAGYDYYPSPPPSVGTAMNPCPGINTAVAGHGTAVASIVGGLTLGVAVGSQLVPVRVFDCGGLASKSRIVAGLQWILTDASLPLGYSRVVNLSFELYDGAYDAGGAGILYTSPNDPNAPYNLAALDNAVISLLNAGITVTAAAGNYNQSTPPTPARVPGVIAVGATDPTDQRWVSSNYGANLTLFAPGVGGSFRPPRLKLGIACVCARLVDISRSRRLPLGYLVFFSDGSRRGGAPTSIVSR